VRGAKRLAVERNQQKLRLRLSILLLELVDIYRGYTLLLLLG